MSWQNLYESSGYYVDAKYEDGENISGYYLVIDNSQPFEEYKGDGYRTGISIIKALGMDAGDFVRGFGTAMMDGSYSYTENGYRVSMFYPGEDSLTSAGMIINFDKQ
ncbi:hypothetical protein BCBBV1cgp32 [Bacillus phage BCASJ1c]|uniref:32 n=1 Tax=Bacillus phage BCASJ1c TaxID=294382 RepID=Q5YA78_9CAUD|nr:hypothetical protein BCBBV1cgp32 [Bacillus phage BCASJ1c]AAU85079.1 32 [Bacillus phage BCASJ1c]